MAIISVKDKVLAQLRLDEKFVPYAYQDSLGFWTIGYGCLIDRRKGGGITRQEGEYLLLNRLKSSEQDLDERLNWWREQPETIQMVLLNMCYNLGINGLLEFKNTLSAIKNRQYKFAGKNLRKSLWYQQVGNRAERLAVIVENTENWNAS